MLTTIKLRGDLGKIFATNIKLQVLSVGEAIRALDANFPGFKKYMIANNRKFLVRSNTLGSMSEKDINLQSTSISEIEIIPVLSGSGKVGKIIIGAMLIAASFYIPGLSAALSTAAMNVGTSLVLSGVMELLFSPPQAEYKDPGNEPSYNFSGPVNTVAQGNPVPVGYGRVLVGSAVISAGITTTTTGS